MCHRNTSFIIHKRMKQLIIGLSALLLATGCTSGKRPAPAQQAPVKKEFIMAEVPVTISDPAQRADYLALHYWDRFNFADTSYIGQPEVTEQALSNYIDVLNYTSSPQVAAEAIKGMLTKAEADSAMFAHFGELYEKYLHDPNSPMRNEELYIPVLEQILASPLTDDVHKIRPQHLLDLALRNRPGAKATDFGYTLASGASGRLYGVASPYVLLFFYNPDCNMCKAVHEQLTGSRLITEMQKKKLLKIIALYPDEDITAWKKHLPVVPREWVNGYDKELKMRNEELYDLKAIPTLYLLDKDKKVILKDVTFEYLAMYLENTVK